MRAHRRAQRRRRSGGGCTRGKSVLIINPALLAWIPPSTFPSPRLPRSLGPPACDPVAFPGPGTVASVGNHSCRRPGPPISRSAPSAPPPARTRSLPAPFPLITHPSSCPPASYMALRASSRWLRFVPVAGNTQNLSRLVGRAGGWHAILGPFFPFILVSVHRRRQQ
jgi:hypothetical protein